MISIVIIKFVGREGDWLWIHNKVALTDASWAANRPVNLTGNSEDCVVMVLKNNQVFWEDHNCLSPDVKHHPVAPVCQQDITSSEQHTTTEQPETSTVLSCPDNWTEFNNNCYQFVSSSMYWSDADTNCLKKGGRLTSVHSAEEDKFLQSLASGNSFWLGGYPSGDTWGWSDGTDFDYTNFYSTDQGNCLYQYSSYYSSGWTTADCIYPAYYFICKLLN